MKNKKLLYILIPLAILVWGYVIFMIFNASSSSETIILSDKSRLPFQMKDTTRGESFIILANYRDPFLGKIYRPRNRITKTKIIKKAIPKKIEPVIRWPNIRYGGIIVNKKTQKKVALVRINENDYLMQEKDVNQGVELKKMYPDSVQLIYQQKTRTIWK